MMVIAKENSYSNLLEGSYLQIFECPITRITKLVVACV